MKQVLSAAALFSLLAVPAFAPATAQGRVNDVQCLLVSNLYATQAKEPKAKQIATSSASFYAGRVSQLANGRLRAAMIAQDKQINPQNAGAFMNSCAQAMTASMTSIQAVAKSTLNTKP